METTEISLKGEVKKRSQKQCQYGPDGKPQKTPVEAASQPQQQQKASGGRRRGGAIKKEIVEKKVDEMKDYMERVAALVHEYAPPDREKIQAAQQAGNVSLTPTGKAATITIKNYLKQGDSVVIGFDAAAKKIDSYAVSSFLDNPKDDAVKLAVTFAQIPSGPNHVDRVNLDVPGKKIGVTVTNSGYRTLGQ